jgi:hypothetical protein
MAESFTKIIFDGNTGQVSEIPFSDDEIADYNSFKSEQGALIAEQQAKSNAKASALAKLAALGLTEEEIAAL